MAVLDRSYYGDTDINYGWSLLELSDALKAQGNQKEAAPLYEKAVWTYFVSVTFKDWPKKYGISEQQLRDQEAEASQSPQKLQKEKELAVTLRHDVFGDGDKVERKEGDKNLAPPRGRIDQSF